MLDRLDQYVQRAGLHQEPVASTENPISRSSAASMVLVKSESSTSRIRAGVTVERDTRSTLTARAGAPQGAHVVRACVLAASPTSDTRCRSASRGRTDCR